MFDLMLGSIADLRIGSKNVGIPKRCAERSRQGSLQPVRAGGRVGVILLLAALTPLGGGCAPRDSPAITAESLSPYSDYLALRGDLHIHSSTGSFDSRCIARECLDYSAEDQLIAARSSGLDFAAITEHDRDPAASRPITDEEWRTVVKAVESTRTPQFVGLFGYEWTSEEGRCFWLAPDAPSFGHKIVIMPLTEAGVCGLSECSTPDALASWAAARQAVVITAHPWRLKLLNGSGISVRRDYFRYAADGPTGVMVGLEVGPDFPVLSWASLCESPKDSISSQTTTLDEWKSALAAGKHLAAVASSDRHFGLTPFGLRTTVLFATSRTEAALLDAIRSRRTMACNLDPFPVRFSVDGQVVGSRVKAPREARIELDPSVLDQVSSAELWLGGVLLARWDSLPPDGNVQFAIPDSLRGPLWLMVSGRGWDSATGTRRMTITSPIFLED